MFAQLLRCSTIVAIFILVGCGSGGADKEFAPDPADDGVTITVEQGGELFFGDGFIRIPELAVSEQLVLKVATNSASTGPDADNTLSNIFTVAPTNVALLDQASLEINMVAADSEKVVIAQLINDVWVPNYTSLRDSEKVVARINEFGVYALRKLPEVEISKTIGPACDTSADTQRIRFVHVADLHSRFGYKERHYAKIKQLHLDSLAQQPYTLFTNGGDDYEKGTVAEQTSNGRASSEAIKAMEFDVRVVGNHDYAWGEQELLDYVKDPNAVVLASNTTYTGSVTGGFETVDFAKVEMGCITLGIIGMTSGPWNELDVEYKQAPLPDFIDNFKMNYDFEAAAEGLHALYGDEVDYFMMVSHLGYVDQIIGEEVEGIALALGGHSHNKPQIFSYDDGKNIVIEPDIYGAGAAVFEVDFDLVSKTATPVSTNIDNIHVPTAQLTDINDTVATKIDEIMGRYAPDANTSIGVSENFPNRQQVEQVVANATMHVANVDGALLGPYDNESPFLVVPWQAGDVTQEDFHNAFQVERQPSNTPGFNSLYQVSVSGAQLKLMVETQATWQLYGINSIDDTTMYNLALYKGAAWNPQLFFNNVTFSNVVEIGETWWVLDQFARFRTSQCLHLDSETRLNACIADDQITIWQFDDNENKLEPEFGPAEMGYFDPDNDTWFVDAIEQTQVSELVEDVPLLRDGDSGILKFERFSPREGFVVTHNAPPNGDYEIEGLVSDYTLVYDILWPDNDTLDRFHSLLQTDASNTEKDDAELYLEPADEVTKVGGVGISTIDDDGSQDGYCGAVQPNTWYRLAFVFFAAPDGGTFKIYIDGELACEKGLRNIDSRWALDSQFLLFTDGNWNTRPSYVNAFMFAGRTLNDAEVGAMAGASKTMSFMQQTRSLNETVERHMLSAPARIENPWLKQREKFFGKVKN